MSIPLWMTDPAAAEWIIRDIPRPSRDAMSELQGLVAMIFRNPVSPETGDCHETSKTEDSAEEAPLARPPRINLPRAVKEEAVSALRT